MSKYTGMIALDLTRKGEIKIPCSAFNRIWLPKQVLVGGVVYGNPTDAIVQIRFDESGSDGEGWAVQDAMRNSESGEASQVLYKVIHPTATGLQFLYLQTGMDIAGGYGNADGISPVIGIGSSGNRLT